MPPSSLLDLRWAILYAILFDAAVLGHKARVSSELLCEPTQRRDLPLYVAVGWVKEGYNNWIHTTRYQFQLARWMGGIAAEPCVDPHGKIKRLPKECLTFSTYFNTSTMGPSTPVASVHKQLAVVGKDGKLCVRRAVLQPPVTYTRDCGVFNVTVAASNESYVVFRTCAPRTPQEAQSLVAAMLAEGTTVLILDSTSNPKEDGLPYSATGDSTMADWCKHASPRCEEPAWVPPVNAIWDAVRKPIHEQIRGLPFVVAQWRTELMEMDETNVCQSSLQRAVEDATLAIWKEASPLQRALPAHVPADMRPRLPVKVVLMSDLPSPEFCPNVDFRSPKDTTKLDDLCSVWSPRQIAMWQDGRPLRAKDDLKKRGWLMADALVRNNLQAPYNNNLGLLLAEQLLASHADRFLSGVHGGTGDPRRHVATVCGRGRSTAGSVAIARTVLGHKEPFTGWFGNVDVKPRSQGGPP